MARVPTVLLCCLAALLALAACGPANAAPTMRRTETAIVAARQNAPATNPVALPPPAAAVDEATRAAFENAERPLVRGLEHDRTTWQNRLRAVPELSHYATRFTPFDGKAADAALRRADRSHASVTAWSIADGPFAWSPARGVEYWVTSGSIGDRSLVAVLELLPSGHLRHAASLVIDDKDTSVALGTSSDHPTEVLWTTCYGCPGEGGSITLGDDGRPRFVYR